jgi:acyl-CoA synthetase (AMP-forming)/AMP-acid ligase II
MDTDPRARSAAYRAAGFWDDRTLVDVVNHWADLDPTHPYLVDGTTTMTYGEFRDRAWRLAGALAARGVGPGDRVAVQLPNWHEFFLVYAACARLGAITIPVVVIYRGSEVGFIVENSAAVALVTCGEFRGFDHGAMAREVADSVSHPVLRVVVRGEPDDGAVALSALLDGDTSDGQALPDPPSADDPHLILYSSGTESRPKGCLHTWNTSSFLPKQAVEALAMGRDDVMFMPSPVTHALGLTLGVMAPTLSGAAVSLLDVFDPRTALERVGRDGCTGTASPAPFLRMMLDAHDPAVHDVSALRFWLTAGAPIPTALVQDAAVRFPGCRVVSAYGSSEVMMATVCRPEDPVERVASSDGRPVPGVEIRIVDPDGTTAALGTAGEIRYRGPGRLLEYWQRPDLTAAALDPEGWWGTGDLGRVDEAGYLRVTGRIKDIIIRGGFNISAREVEETLVAHPSIRDAAVIGLPDPELGERACAVVVADPGAAEPPTLAGLRRHLHDEHRMAVWKVPERIEVVEALPTTATGKVQKYALRERFAPTPAVETA